MSPAGNIVLSCHSKVCPRCQLSGIALRRVPRRDSDVEVTKIEFLTNRDRAKNAGVTFIPTLVSGGRSLTGIILTPARIERFLESLTADRG